MICEFYVTTHDGIYLYEPYFSEAIRFLEINGFIISTDGYEDLIYAVPRIVALDDHETVILCSETCSCSVIDFEAGTS